MAEIDRSKVVEKAAEIDRLNYKWTMQERLGEQLGIEAPDSLSNELLAMVIAVLDEAEVSFYEGECEQVKNDGEVCGRTRPCQYHDEE